MSTVLGKLAVGALSDERGPDVTHLVRVPVAWLMSGETIELDLPRNLACAKCEGGGCDQCDRAGAFSLRDKQAPVQTLQVSLPQADGSAGENAGKSLMLRIPDHGGPSTVAGVPRGLLMLKVVAAAAADPGVRLSRSAASMGSRSVPRELVIQSVVIGAVLILLFLVMLRLSGWL